MKTLQIVTEHNVGKIMETLIANLNEEGKQAWLAFNEESDLKENLFIIQSHPNTCSYIGIDKNLSIVSNYYEDIYDSYDFDTDENKADIRSFLLEGEYGKSGVYFTDIPPLIENKQKWHFDNPTILYEVTEKYSDDNLAEVIEQSFPSLPNYGLRNKGDLKYVEISKEEKLEVINRMFYHYKRNTTLNFKEDIHALYTRYTFITGDELVYFLNLLVKLEMIRINSFTNQEYTCILEKNSY